MEINENTSQTSPTFRLQTRVKITEKEQELCKSNCIGGRFILGILSNGVIIVFVVNTGHTLPCRQSAGFIEITIIVVSL